MKNPRTYIILFLVVSLLLFGLLYGLVIRPYVNLAYEGNAPDWFQQIIDFLYPRFEVEKQRFELSFFLNKADQILIRLFLVVSCICILFLNNFSEKLLDEHSRLHSQDFYRVLIIMFYTGLLYYTWQWIFEFEQIVRMKSFYKGVLLYRLLQLPILPLQLFYVLYILYILSIGFILVRYQEVVFSAIAAVLLVLFQGYAFSFEKIDHGHATLTYATMLMPALLYELKLQRYNIDQTYFLPSSWILFLIRLSIAGTYFLAGLEKLLSSGFDWATAETFRSYIALHGQPVGIRIAQNDFLAHFLPWTALLFQLGFILVLFQQRLKYLFLILGVCFHVGTKILLDIGPYFSSWIFVYIFFVDWDVLLKRWKDWTTSRHNKSQNGA